MADEAGIDIDAVLSGLSERLPKLGDLPFRPPPRYWLADIATYPGERMYRQTKGYKAAGDLLSVHAECASDDTHRRNLIYPAIFTYRQYIELALKGIIEAHGTKAGVSPNRSHHSLTKLWRDFLAVIEEAGHMDPSEETTRVVGMCVAEFDRVDPQSLAFRYPTDKMGNQTTIPFEVVDLSNLRDVMDGIQNYLECCEMELQAADDAASSD